MPCQTNAGPTWSTQSSSYTHKWLRPQVATPTRSCTTPTHFSWNAKISTFTSTMRWSSLVCGYLPRLARPHRGFAQGNRLQITGDRLLIDFRVHVIRIQSQRFWQCFEMSAGWLIRSSDVNMHSLWLIIIVIIKIKNNNSGTKTFTAPKSSDIPSQRHIKTKWLGNLEIDTQIKAKYLGSSIREALLKSLNISATFYRIDRSYFLQERTVTINMPVV